MLLRLFCRSSTLCTMRQIQSPSRNMSLLRMCFPHQKEGECCMITGVAPAPSPRSATVIHQETYICYRLRNDFMLMYIIKTNSHTYSHIWYVMKFVCSGRNNRVLLLSHNYYQKLITLFKVLSFCYYQMRCLFQRQIMIVDLLCCCLI